MSKVKQGEEEEKDDSSSLSEDEQLFLEAMKDVKECSDREERIIQKKAPLSSIQVVSQKKSSEITLLSDGEDVGPLSQLSFSRSNLSRKVLKQLRKGKLPIHDTIDLHGYTWKEAKAELHEFVGGRFNYKSICLLVIHGKGHGNIQGGAKLKAMSFRYLKALPIVLALQSALPKDGGLGATYVLLKASS